MANLFLKQAKQYSHGRPNYPEELFQFIASKTPTHDLVWDVATGSGQAAISLSKIFKNVIATDTSPTLLELAPKISNIRYECTPPKLSMAELETNVGKESSVDLITVATAIHYLDLPTFYQQAKWILKKPNGVIAAWTYNIPNVNESVDFLLQRLYTVDADPYFAPEKRPVENQYRTLDFPFEAVDGCDGNGPFEFKAEKMMGLQDFFTYIKSWSAYPIAKEKGVELLRDEVVEEFTNAWNEDGQSQKIVTFPIYLKIGKVGNPNR